MANLKNNFKMQYKRGRRYVMRLNAHQKRIYELSRQLWEDELSSGQEHELRQFTRVLCRVRPSLPGESIGSQTPVISYPKSTEAIGQGITLLHDGREYPFVLDKVFDDKASQQEVFDEISDRVTSTLLDDNKVCISACGQTGSGKTYTMLGRLEPPEEEGLIPRSLRQIFEVRHSLELQGWKYKIQASMFEIGDGTISDLLAPSWSTTDDTIQTESRVVGKQYTISHEANGNTHVPDLTMLEISSVKEILPILYQATQRRSVCQSSMSHFVIILRIFGEKEGIDRKIRGVLSLEDLVGRSSSNNQVKKRRLELLVNVHRAHVGNGAQYLMLVNISPEVSSTLESYISLQCAVRGSIGY